MEQSLNSYIKGYFGCQETDIHTYSPLTLAYIGDTVFDIVVRSVLVNNGNTKVEKLHKRASAIVKATSQCKMIKLLLEKGELTAEEQEIFKRGRNAKPHTTAKSATTMEYMDATGFEALVGWLYLLDKWERILQLLKMAIDECDLWNEIQQVNHES